MGKLIEYGVLVLFILLGIIVFSSDISYSKICPDGFIVDKDASIDYFTSLSLVDGLKNSICIYPPTGYASDYMDEKDMPKPYIMFYQGEINLFIFILKFFSIMSLSIMYLSTRIKEFSYDIKRMDEPINIFMVLSVILSCLIFSLFLLIYSGVF